MSRAIALVLFIAIASTARADFIHVAGFEETPLYANAQPYTIAVADGDVVDLPNGRSIPVRVRWPAEVAAAGTPMPVVVWVHGGDADPNGRAGSREWSEHFVRAGYITVHPSIMPRTQAETLALWAAFGLDAQAGQDCTFNPVYVDRPRDTSAVIDALPALGTRVPALAGLVDTSRVVVAGHSFGAYTARAVAGARLDLCPTGIGAPAGWPYRDVQFRDPRPLAFVALSPQGPGRFAFFEQSWTGLDRPDFSATGAADITPGQGPLDRLQSFVLIRPGSKYMLYLDDADATHAAFNLNEPAAADLEPWLVAQVLAFVDAYARGDARAAESLHAGAVLAAGAGVVTFRWK
jgi:pimeloyl-ACP methyl ester carboxylesterase